MAWAKSRYAARRSCPTISTIPELTLETIVDGWLLTGDLGRFERQRTSAAVRPQEEHDRHRGRERISIPKTSRRSSTACPSRNTRIVAANYIWPKKELGQRGAGHRPAPGAKPDVRQQAARRRVLRNRRLPDFKRVGGYLVWDTRTFPRTASMKVKRQVLAEEIAQELWSARRCWGCETNVAVGGMPRGHLVAPDLA
jgi:hypothetical protein